jgi:hypothetical protein
MFNKNNRWLGLLASGFVGFYFIWVLLNDYADWLSDSPYLNNLLPLLLGAGPAFLIWFWRDQNKQADIKNKQAEIKNEQANIRIREQTFFLQDFYQLQQLAAGQETTEVLKVAALYQLRPFLNGSKGDHYVRPTWSLFRAFLDQWHPKTEYDDFNFVKSPPDFPEHIRVIHTILREESKQASFRRFYNQEIDLTHLNLPFANLSGANFEGACFDHSYLRASDFRNSFLTKAQFSLADLEHAKFNVGLLPVTIAHVGFSGSKILSTHFDSVTFVDCTFEYARVSQDTFTTVLDMSGCRWINGVDILSLEDDPGTGEKMLILKYARGEPHEIMMSVSIEDHRHITNLLINAGKENDYKRKRLNQYEGFTEDTPEK